MMSSTSTELPPVPQLVRKSAYGRTQLFLPTRGAMLREVKNMGGVERLDRANVYHVLDESYRSKKDVACWHCCEMIAPDELRIPLPRIYDTAEKAYHVYGTTCCAGCAKAFVLESTTFDRGQHLNVLMKMLREVFGITGDICETPPRPALKRFGGMFDPARMRNTDRERVRNFRLVEPPFISYCMIIEEHLGSEAAAAGLSTDWTTQKDATAASTSGTTTTTAACPAPAACEDVDMLEEPQPPGLFVDYMQSRKDGKETVATQNPSSSSSDDAGSFKNKRTRESAATNKNKASDGATTINKARPSKTKPQGPMTKFYASSSSDQTS